MAAGVGQRPAGIERAGENALVRPGLADESPPVEGVTLDEDDLPGRSLRTTPPTRSAIAPLAWVSLRSSWAIVTGRSWRPGRTWWTRRSRWPWRSGRASRFCRLGRGGLDLRRRRYRCDLYQRGGDRERHHPDKRYGEKIGVACPPTLRRLPRRVHCTHFKRDLPQAKQRARCTDRACIPSTAPKVILARANSLRQTQLI